MDLVNCVDEMKMQEVVTKIEVQENYNNEEIKLKIKEEKEEIVEFSHSEESTTSQNLLSCDLQQEVYLYLQNLLDRIEFTEESRKWPEIKSQIKKEKEEIMEFSNTEASVTSEKLLSNVKLEVNLQLQVVLERLEFPEENKKSLEIKSQIKNENAYDMGCSICMKYKSDQEKMNISRLQEITPLVEEVTKKVEFLERQRQMIEKKDPNEEVIHVLQEVMEKVEFGEGSGHQQQPQKRGRKRKILPMSRDVLGRFMKYPKKRPSELDILTSSLGSIKLKRRALLHNSPIANRTRAKLYRKSKRLGKKSF